MLFATRNWLNCTSAVQFSRGFPVLPARRTNILNSSWTGETRASHNSSKYRVTQMSPHSYQNPLISRFAKGALSVLVAGGLAFAQNAPDGWPRADDPSRNQPAPPADNQGPEAPAASGPSTPAPPRLTIRPGTFVTVRVNQTLSSDRNQAGDAFSATLVRPIVVDGVVVAQRGQTLGGRVAEASKAGRIEGTSRLAIQLTDLTLVDGQQLPVQSQFISRAGSTSVGRDAGAVAGTTALGAAVGGMADWGRGAAIGAGAGAAAGIIGVLLTRGHPTVVYPESVLTFRIEAPVIVATDRAPEAFRYVEPADYDQPSDHQPPAYAQMPPTPACAGYGCAPPPPPYYYYGPSYYPAYWGPSLYFYSGPRFYGPRYYGYRRGYSRGYRR
jgi:hypothetical protein